MSAKQVLIWLCVCHSANSTSKFENIAHIMCTLLIFTGQITGAITHLIYLLEFGSVDLKGSVFSFMGVVVYGSIVYITITVFSLRYRIRAVLKQLATIYTRRE